MQCKFGLPDLSDSSNEIQFDFSWPQIFYSQINGLVYRNSTHFQKHDTAKKSVVIRKSQIFETKVHLSIHCKNNGRTLAEIFLYQFSIQALVNF